MSEANRFESEAIHWPNVSRDFLLDAEQAPAALSARSAAARTVAWRTQSGGVAVTGSMGLACDGGLGRLFRRCDPTIDDSDLAAAPTRELEVVGNEE